MVLLGPANQQRSAGLKPVQQKDTKSAPGRGARLPPLACASARAPLQQDEGPAAPDRTCWPGFAEALDSAFRVEGDDLDLPLRGGEDVRSPASSQAGRPARRLSQQLRRLLPLTAELGQGEFVPLVPGGSAPVGEQGLHRDRSVATLVSSQLSEVSSCASLLASASEGLGSSLRPGMMPRDPRWLRREISNADQQQRSKGADDEDEVLESLVDVRGLQPGQADFVRGLFGSCLPRTPKVAMEFARQERERQQLAEADKVGVRVAHRIAKRHKQPTRANQPEGGAGHDTAAPILPGLLGRDVNIEKLEAIAGEAVPVPKTGTSSDSPRHLSSQTPQPGSMPALRPRHKQALMRLIHLHQDRGSRLLKIDILSRSFWKRTNPVAGQPGNDLNIVSTPKGRSSHKASTASAGRSGSTVGIGTPKRRLQEAVDPWRNALQAVFTRYDLDDTGMLDEMETRNALYDLGLRPSWKDRSLVLQQVSEAVNDSESHEGITFGEFQPLTVQVRGLLRELQAPDLQEWYERGLDEHGQYDVRHVQACLKGLGVKARKPDEWQEALKLFDGFAEAAHGLTGRGRMRSAGQALVNRITSWGQQLRTESAGDIQYELFELLVLRSQEVIIALHRARERSLAEEHRLPEEQFDEFREDLLELHELFSELDARAAKQLGMEQVMDLLTACGCIEAGNWPTRERLQTMTEQAKAIGTQRGPSLTMSRSHKPLLKPEEVCPPMFPITEGEDEGEQPRAKEKLPPAVQVDFFEFLHVLRLVRRSAREQRRAHLLEIFGRHDPQSTGVVATKDMSRLLRDIKTQPRNREEQLEMARICDEADENGEGVLVFAQFELLVQRMREQIERLSRREEEAYALELGLQLPRIRVLRRIFECNVSVPGNSSDAGLPSPLEGPKVVFMRELRSIMTLLKRKYSSEDLLSLYQTFSRQDLGGVDGRGFLRMMHAIEVAKTHGQTTRG